MEEEGKKAGDPEYDKLSNEIHLLDMKKEYLLSSEKVKNISVQIEALDPLTNTDQINALENIQNHHVFQILKMKNLNFLCYNNHKFLLYFYYEVFLIN